MLFRIETAVWVVIASSALMITPTFAADRSTSSFDGEGYLKQCQASGKDFNTCDDLLTKKLRALSGKEDDDKKECSDAAKEFAKSAKKFGGACGKLDLPANANECAEKMKKCGKKDDDSAKSAACPSSGANAEKYKDEAQKIEDEVSKLKDKLGTFDDKIAELNEQANKQVQETQKQMAKMQTEFNNEEAKRRTAYTDGMNQFQKQAVAQIQQMQQKYDELTLQMKQIPTRIAQAQIQNYDQTVTKLRLDCHNQALQIVQKRQADNMAKIAKSQYTVGGLNNIIKTLGLTDEQRYEIQAMYYEKKCLNDSAYVQQVNLADKTARIVRQSIMSEKDGLVQQQSRLIQNIGTLMSQNQLDRSQAYQKMQTEEAAARQAYTTEMGSLQSQLSTVQNSTQTKMASINNQKQLLNSQIEQKNSYLQGKQALAKAADEAAKGRDYSKEDASKVYEGLADTTHDAEAGNVACKCDDSGSADKKSCSLFQNFLSASLDSSRSSISSGDDEEDYKETPTPAGGPKRSTASDPFSGAPATSVTPSDNSGGSWLNNGTTTYGTGASPGTSN